MNIVSKVVDGKTVFVRDDVVDRIIGYDLDNERLILSSGKAEEMNDLSSKINEIASLHGTEHGDDPEFDELYILVLSLSGMLGKHPTNAEPDLNRRLCEAVGRHVVEIKNLKAENERLKRALEPVLNININSNESVWDIMLYDCQFRKQIDARMQQLIEYRKAILTAKNLMKSGNDKEVSHVG